MSRIFGVKPPIKSYRYTGDDGRLYYIETAEHLGVAAGLMEIQRKESRQYSALGPLNPRYVWAKEVVPSSAGHTKRVKLVVEAENPLYKQGRSLPVEISGKMYVTTGRIGETLTWGASPSAIENCAKLTSEQKTAD